MVTFIVHNGWNATFIPSFSVDSWEIPLNDKSSRVYKIHWKVWNTVCKILLPVSTKRNSGCLPQFYFNTMNGLLLCICMYTIHFSKFYGKVGVISWLLFHFIWKNYVLNWDWIELWIFHSFFTRPKKIPQNDFSRQKGLFTSRHGRRKMSRRHEMSTSIKAQYLEN